MTARQQAFRLMVVLSLFFIGCGTSVHETPQNYIPFKIYITEGFDNAQTDYIDLLAGENSDQLKKV